MTFDLGVCYHQCAFRVWADGAGRRISAWVMRPGRSSIRPYLFLDHVVALHLVPRGNARPQPCAKLLPWYPHRPCIPKDWEVRLLGHLAGGLVGNAQEILNVFHREHWWELLEYILRCEWYSLVSSQEAKKKPDQFPVPRGTNPAVHDTRPEGRARSDTADEL